MAKQTYIHYGSDKFSPEITKNLDMYKWTDKPSGLWASPEISTWGWKQWCESEEYHTERLQKSFRFTLKPNAKILHINSFREAIPFLINDTDYGRIYELNLEKIYQKYDGIEVWMSKDWENFHYTLPFSTWDVDSLCVWNTNVIKII